ncbi:hypothetical protein [Halioxenophilus sp. WMMB6]|uniref:hypothetical protein n=1 Tax=Halioxenophilus sp. WMMB6 TaxID=3073815 RepID=UPI00295E2797|nr:hypothetical protein [Halioxenophilus sp. WMMB6]
MFSMLWLIGVGLIVAALLSHYLFIRRLQLHHGDLYHALGTPAFSTQYPISRWLQWRKPTNGADVDAYSEFMLNSGWLSIADPRLTCLALIRCYAQVALGLLLLAVVAIYLWLV